MIFVRAQMRAVSANVMKTLLNALCNSDIKTTGLVRLMVTKESKLILLF